MHPLVWPFGTKDNVPTTIYHYSTASTVSTGLTFLHQRQCPHHHIPLFHCALHPLHIVSTASSGLTFLHQRQCPHHHIPLIHRDLHPLHTAFTVFCGLTFLYQRQCSHYHIPLFHYILHPASTSYCVHCMPYMAYVGNLFCTYKVSPSPANITRNSWNHYEPKTSYFQSIPNVPTTNQKSAKKLHFSSCVTNLNHLTNSLSH